MAGRPGPDPLNGFLSFLQRQLLPVGLLIVAVIGMLFPEPGRLLNASPIPKYAAVSIIFVCSGLLLRTDEIYAALSAWRRASLLHPAPRRPATSCEDRTIS